MVDFASSATRASKAHAEPTEGVATPAPVAASVPRRPGPPPPSPASPVPSAAANAPRVSGPGAAPKATPMVYAPSGERGPVSVRGLDAAGQLIGAVAGTGYIKPSLNEGAKAVEAMATELRAEGPTTPGILDVLVIGAGPAGLAAGLRAKKLGLAA